MHDEATIHTLTHAAINDLQNAFMACSHRPTEGLILSAIVTVKKVHDLLALPCQAEADLDPEEYCCAV